MPPTHQSSVVARTRALRLATGDPMQLVDITDPVAWHGLRCGGRSPFVDDPETILRRVERSDWVPEQPRRGRPPRWLAAQRDRQDAA